MKNNKKFYIILSIMLALVFTTKAFASLTFTTNAITGTSASTIDLGAGNALSLQTTNNGKIFLGTGNVGIGTTTPNNLLQVAGLVNFDAVYANTSLGVNNLTAYTTGGSGGFINTAVGQEALRTLTTGTWNDAFGYQSQNDANGDHNASFGLQALRHSTGSNNAAFGSNALAGSGAGSRNVAVGVAALANTTGSDNIGIGYSVSPNGSAGSRNITIGSNIYLADATASNQLNIGNIIFGTGVSGTTNTIAGNIGIGTTNPGALLDVKGHVASSQATAPTASVTGTGYSGASMGSGSTDTKGLITATVGANAGTLVVTFNSAYTTAPVCTVTPTTATAQVDHNKMYATFSTTALTINFAASPTGGSETWSYICLQ